MFLLFETITYFDIISQEKLSSGLKLLVVNRSKDIGAVRHQYQAKEVSALVPIPEVVLKKMMSILGTLNRKIPRDLVTFVSVV